VQEKSECASKATDILMADNDAKGKMMSSCHHLRLDDIDCCQVCTLSHDDCVTGGDRGPAATGGGRSSSSQNVPQYEIVYRGKPS
jgi:hypothetical protein